jgi:hypothetical protein
MIPKELPGVGVEDNLTPIRIPTTYTMNSNTTETKIQEYSAYG